MATRVSLVDAEQAPLLVRHLYAAGDPGVIARALANVPEVAEVAMPFLSVALGPGSAPPVAKEIVILRTSAVLGCRYCVDTHTVVALDMGLGEDRVRALRDTPVGAATSLPDQTEAVLVRWIDAVAGAPGPVAQEVHTALAARFPEHQVVELLVTLGATMLLNRLCTALCLPTSAETEARLAQAGFWS